MTKDTITTVAAGENAGLPDPLLEAPDGEALMLGNLVKRARNGDRKAGSRLQEMGIDVKAAQGPHSSASIYVQEKILDEMGTDRQVEISEVDCQDRLLIRMRDARTGRIQGQYFAEELDSHPGRVFDVVAGITSGAKQLDGDAARQLEAMLTEPDNDIRTYLVAMSKFKMHRGPAVASTINDIEERLESLLRSDDPIKPETLVRLLALKRDEMGTDLDFMRSMITPKKGDPLSAVPPAIHDNRSVDIHEYNRASEFSPARREVLRNMIEAFSGEATRDDRKELGESAQDSQHRIRKAF